MNNSTKEIIENLIKKEAALRFSLQELPPFKVEPPRKKEWGDVSTNLPFLLSKKLKKSPEFVGKELAFGLSKKDIFEKVEFAPPGFINFSLSLSYLQESLRKIVEEKSEFTEFSVGEERPVQVEFVSANPTGPLHVGHGRAAALGDALANILSKLGFRVEREYYVNNVGGQIERLIKSFWVRIKQLEGEKVDLPEDGYKGEYLVEIAKVFKEKEKKDIKGKPWEDIRPLLSRFLINYILEDIRGDLHEFGVKYDRWFFESEIYENRELSEALSFLEKKGLLYEKDGALWFKTSSVIKGEKDRVLRRKTGEYTYFASDIAYHLNKLKRGFYKVIDIWGADHIGYVPRMQAAARAIGYPEDALKIIIYQLVSLRRGERKISASTREGEFISLKELLKEVGKDAARFFFLSRSADSHLDFDLELAKKQTPENPVFYVQYAHARICSILRKAKQKGLFALPEEVDLTLLENPEERELMLLIALLPDQIKEAGQNLEPHHLTVYARNIASAFHYFYTRHRVIDEERKTSLARLFLVEGIKIAIKDILDILGISAPEKM